jgi:ribosomal protein S18 acetylase RimI-like enzyme
MQIRDATPEDAAAVVAIVQQMATDDGDTSPLNEDYVRFYLASECRGALLAEQDGQVVGLLSYSIRPDLYHAGGSALIELLVVRGGQRGVGVGAALVNNLVKRVEDQGCAEVSVSTMPDNQGAIRFYQRLGLTEEAVYLEKHFS